MLRATAPCTKTSMDMDSSIQILRQFRRSADRDFYGAPYNKDGLPSRAVASRLHMHPEWRGHFLRQ